MTPKGGGFVGNFLQNVKFFVFIGAWGRLLPLGHGKSTGTALFVLVMLIGSLILHMSELVSMALTMLIG